ncbi:methyl-accepting chemotaxis sensory transducer [Thalassoporum mexicanum PCC 7367]|uniref:methyl-accepting chemotaxis protein n=1 Tax=Thalassoporum mexicanum TaxID=3457544 RepID=UPI00029F89BF|nr:methyl-accepting chemotaxis protein [Pseudanabaena sp. PCC 7367]AFY69546.1 methyl-accepting chemotaxis sensory transducer [Pseudanabaena sp. PCC 7367]
MTTRYQQALQAYAEGRYEDAMQQFSELLYEDPRNPKLHIWLGATFRKAGKIEYARVQYQQVLTLTDDPDLLDIARTSLAQIQNSAVEAIASDTTGNTGSTSGGLDLSSGSLNGLGDTSSNGLVETANIVDEHQLIEDPDTTQIAPMANTPGGVIPPPGSAAPINHQSLQPPAQPQQSAYAQNGNHPSAAIDDTSAQVAIGANKSTRAKSTRSTSKSTKSTAKPSVRTRKPQSNQVPRKSDTLRPSSLKQRFIFSAFAVAAVTAAGIGFLAYRLNQTKIAQTTGETRELQATSLAGQVGSFMQQQYNSTQMLGNLMSSSNLRPNQPLSAGQKQWLQGRLDLYNQAFSSFDSIALFDVNGNLVAQAKDSINPLPIAPEMLAQIVAAPANAPQIGELIETEQGYAITLTTAIVNPTAQQVALILRVQMPVEALSNAVDNPGNQYAVIDDSGSYVIAEGIGTTGTNATATYPELSQLLATSQPNVNGINTSGQTLAFAPTPSTTTPLDLNWAVLVNADRGLGISDNFIIYLAAAGLALVALMGIIAAIASKSITDPLKQASEAVRQIARGNFNIKLKESSKDEIGILSANINHLATEFQSLLQRQKQEKEHLHQQVLKLFKALQRLAGVEAGEVQISGDSLGLIVNKIETNLVQKEAEANRQRQEKEKLQQHLIEILSDVRELARGDLSVRARSTDGDMKSVSEFFNAVINGLQKIVVNSKGFVAQVDLSIGQNQTAVNQLTADAIKQANEITKTLNSAQLMTISARSIKNNSAEASTAVKNAMTTATSGNEAIENTMQSILRLRATVAATAKKIKRLGESSQRISKVVSLINEISVQTNFLAINAGIEANRAGEAGAGFGSVAEEVGELAARSASAAKEIEQLINGIQAETGEVINAMENGTTQVVESTQLVEESKQSIAEIVAVSEQIDELINTISETTDSHANTAECVSGLMRDLAKVSGRTAGSSKKISDSFKVAVQNIEQLQHSMSKFIVE